MINSSHPGLSDVSVSVSVSAERTREEERVSPHVHYCMQARNDMKKDNIDR